MDRLGDGRVGAEPRPQGPPRCSDPLTFLLVAEARVAWRQGSSPAAASPPLIFVPKAELHPRPDGASCRGRRKGAATEEGGGAAPGRSGPSPPLALPVCNFPCVQSIFRGWISNTYSFFLEEILRHRKMGAEPGGDTESLFRPQGLSLPQDLEQLRKAMRPKGWGSPGLPGLRGWPGVRARLPSCGGRRPLQGFCAVPATLREPGPCTGRSALSKAAWLLGSDLSEHNGTRPAS